MGDFLMPSLGADMEAGTLLEWYVKPGDAVKRGDIVALVDTSKAAIEVEVFEDGVVGELLVDVGQRVPVGAVLARIGPVGSEPPAKPAVVPVAAPEPVSVPAPAVAPVAAPVAVAERPPAVTPDRVRVSPLARRVAQQLGVDLAAVAGSGPEGAIIRADVEQAAAGSAPPASSPAAPATVAPAPLQPVGPEPGLAAAPVTPAAATPNDRHAAMRAAIGALMARSKREIPHYYLQLEVDMAPAVQWLTETNLARELPARILPSALLLRATALAAAEMPEMNGFWTEAGFQPASGVHLGVAISLRGGGLIAPALHDADRKSLQEIMEGVHDLVSRARAGRLRGSEMSDPTLTVTNLGDRGVDLVHGVIYPPQVALVGFGAVRERPWASGGMLGVRPTVIATLAGDHRASDGHAGGRFLSRIAHHLQLPESL